MTKRHGLASRLFSALPAIGVALVIFTFYAIEAWTRKTPIVFTDELEWTQISRSIATTGHAARREQPIFFKSLYAFVIAPFWWIHSTTAAYAAIKYVNAFVMSLTAIPTYFLARMYVTRRSAGIVAVLAVLIPGMSYAASIVPENVAYPWYALSSWVIIRALTKRGRLDYAVAVGACVVAGFIRWPQFATVPASAIIALGLLWLTGPRGRAMRSSWSRSDYVGAIVLFIGFMMLFNRVILQHEQIWQVSTQYDKGRMLDLGLKAGLALTIGMGVLPIIGGLASLRLQERVKDPAYRAFVAYLGASIVCLSLYTAVKAAFLSTVFSTLTEERNLIYLSPLLLIGTAMAFESRRIDWRIVAAASAFVGWLVFAKPTNDLFPYFEAPGFAVLDVFERHFEWTILDRRLLMIGVLFLSVVALVWRHMRWVGSIAVVLVAAWMLTSEIATTVGTDQLANPYRRSLPAHLDWIDRLVGKQPVTYLGQEMANPNGLFLTEFWNRQIRHVDSLDGSAPGPGPTAGPNVVEADGKLDLLDNVPYIVADNGVRLQAPIVSRCPAVVCQLVLYKADGPWRLLDAYQQVYTDGWAPAWSTYTYFKTGQSGTLVVSLKRTAYNGTEPPADVRVTVGTVKIVNAQAELGHVFGRRHVIIQNGPGSLQQLRFAVARSPVRVVIRVKHTVRIGSDPRNLGVQVDFNFLPAQG